MATFIYGKPECQRIQTPNTHRFRVYPVGFGHWIMIIAHAHSPPPNIYD